MKIAVLCNGPLAIPSIRLLIEKKSLAGIAAPLTFDPFPFRIQDFASEYQIPFSIIHKEKVEAELQTLIQTIDPDCAFVMLWPSKISSELLKLTRLGFYNFHPGLLPQYRGPDPVFWEIKNGEASGGITVHKMNDSVDRGPIACIDRVPIAKKDSYSDHWEKLAESATRATEYMIAGLLTGIQLIPQDESIARYWHTPSAADRTIDWKNQTADSVLALIRASAFYGGAIVYFRKAPICILRASTGAQSFENAEPGNILATTPFTISCKDSTSVCLQEIRTDRILSAPDFCEIFKPREGESLINKT